MFRSSIQDVTNFVLSMEQFPPDDIPESLYKFRIRECQKLKTVLELYNLETNQKRAKPHYHRLKTLVKRSIDQDLRSRNCEARNGRVEPNIFCQASEGQRRVLKGQGECWQWQASWQFSKGDNCSFRHDEKKRAKPTAPPAPSPEPSTPQDGKNPAKAKQKSQRPKSIWEECLACRARIILRVLARMPHFTRWILQSACSTREKRGANLEKSTRSRTDGLRNNPAKGLREMAKKVQQLC